MTLSLTVWEKEGFDLDHGKFSNVLYVLGLASTLLLVYHMTHTGSPKKVIISPNDVYITEFSNGKVIAKGVVYQASKVYMFSHFFPYSDPYALLIHANEESKLWHEIFGHLKYKYLSKRKNRSLKEMETCMMEAKTLPRKFWVEAINCASYI